MADTETVETVDQEELSPADKLAEMLGKAEGEKDGDDKDEDYDDNFKAKMKKYMGTAEGKKMYSSCNKAEDEEPEQEPLSKASELLAAGREEMETAREEVADEGGDEQPLGYYLHLHDGNTFWKAQEALIDEVGSLKKALGELIAAQKESVVLQKATASALVADLKNREELAKAEGMQPNEIKGKRQDLGDMAPPPSAGADSVNVEATNTALLKAVEDGHMPQSDALGLVAMVKRSNGHLGALPDDVRAQIKALTDKEVA